MPCTRRRWMPKPDCHGARHRSDLAAHWTPRSTPDALAGGASSLTAAPAAMSKGERTLAFELGDAEPQLARPQRQPIDPVLQFCSFFRETHELLGQEDATTGRNVRLHQLDRNGLNRGVGLYEAVAGAAQAHLGIAQLGTGIMDLAAVAIPFNESRLRRRRAHVGVRPATKAEAESVSRLAELRQPAFTPFGVCGEVRCHLELRASDTMNTNPFGR